MSGFRNAVARGATLVREALRSQNFQSGVAGWELDRDGNAELNDITVRGTLTSGATPDRIDVGTFLVGGKKAITFDQGQLNRGSIVPSPNNLTISPPNAGALGMPTINLQAGATSTITIAGDVVETNEGPIPAGHVVGLPGGQSLIFKAGSNVVDTAVLGRVEFDTPFPNGLLAVIATLGDQTGGTSVLSHSRDTTKFDVAVFTGAGGAPGGLYRIDWVAFGW